MMRPNIVNVTALNKVYPSGEVTIGLVIEYAEPIAPDSITTTTFSVSGRHILNVHVANTWQTHPGNFVILTLDPKDSLAATTSLIAGMARNVDGPRLHITQVSALKTNTGQSFISDPLELHVTTVQSELVDAFEQHIFKTHDGHQLAYNLYVPKQSDQPQPLLLFMHDASAISSDPTATLRQGIGATTWADSTEQDQRPCFVLAPQYEEQTADDDFTVTWECEATVELVEHIKKAYRIDTNRVYATGQSMGSMMLCEMNFTHPDLFAASFIVAGQWEPQKIATLTNSHLWILVSEIDHKAFPIMTSAMEKLAAKNVTIAQAKVDAKANDAAKADFVERTLSQHAQIQFTQFEGATVLPAGVADEGAAGHFHTWWWAFEIEGIKTWLFSQKKSGE